MKHEEVVQMSFFSKVKNVVSTAVRKYKRATPKQLVLTGVFMLALAGAIGGGLASKGFSHAIGQSFRECDVNSIDNQNYNGGCGALTPGELIADVRNNHPGDLQTIYGDPRIGLSSDKYDRFAATAKEGTITKDGNLTVDGEVVMTDVWTMGRTTLGNVQRTPIYIGGNTYYHSPPSVSFGRWDLDAMVMFDDQGTVEAVVMESCGNPVTQGNKVKSGAECKALQYNEVSKDTYTFTVDANKWGLARYVDFVYSYSYDNGKTWQHLDTTTSPTAVTKAMKFTKTAQVKVDVEYNLPGSRGKTRTISSTLCQKVVKVEEEKFVYTCKNLYATSADNITFRFNAVPQYSSNVKLISADFTLDGKTSTKGVTDQNNKGEIYKEYTFTDEKTHKVTVVINYQYTKDGVTKNVHTQTSKDCTAQVTPKQKPVCKYNPNLPPESPKCHPPETCETNPSKEGCELPNTGPAGMAGLFAGVSAAGAAAHRVVNRLRRR